MTIEVSQIVMPNDPTIVNPETGQLTPAWLHYLGQLVSLANKTKEVAGVVNSQETELADHESRITALEP